MKEKPTSRPQEHWTCAKCNEPLTESLVQVQYLGNAFTMKLLTCPTCGFVLVTEEAALGRMAEAEKVLEDK